MLGDPMVKICLLAISPASEHKIKKRLGGFVERGGRFYSIFPGGDTRTLVD